jgi:hypothetical protein
MSTPMAESPKRRRVRRRFDDFKGQAVRLVLDESKSVGTVGSRPRSDVNLRNRHAKRASDTFALIHSIATRSVFSVRVFPPACLPIPSPTDIGKPPATQPRPAEAFGSPSQLQHSRLRGRNRASMAPNGCASTSVERHRPQMIHLICFFARSALQRARRRVRRVRQAPDD